MWESGTSHAYQTPRKSYQTSIDMPLYSESESGRGWEERQTCGVVYEFRRTEGAKTRTLGEGKQRRKSQEKRALRLYLTACAWLLTAIGCGIALYGTWAAVMLMVLALVAGLLTAREANLCAGERRKA